MGEQQVASGSGLGIAEQLGRHAERRFELSAEMSTAAIAPGKVDVGE
jgi:hypothetical protein